MTCCPPSNQSHEPNISIGDSTSCLLLMVRNFSGEFDNSQYTISDIRLMELLNVSAMLVATELGCCANVKVPPVTCCDELDIIEYPSFAVLIALKASCMAGMGAAKKAAVAAGITAKCGPATLSLSSGASDALKALAETGPCGMYKDLLRKLCVIDPLCTANFCHGLIANVFVPEYYCSSQPPYISGSDLYKSYK